MKKRLHDVLKTVVEKLGVPSPEIVIELPREESFGDLATPVAMSLSKILKKPPRKIAEDIAGAIEEKEIFEKIDIAGPGFINFTFSKAYLHSELRKIITDGPAILRENIGKGKRIQIEFVSANPTGPLHLGHGRGAAFGAALANLLTAGGYKVEREYYINDAGKQVLLLGKSVFARYMHLCGAGEYAFPDDGYRGDYIEDVAKEFKKEVGKKYCHSALKESPQQGIIAAQEFAYGKMLDIIKKDLGEFGVLFDTWQSERELYKSSDVTKAIEDLRSHGHIFEKDGATWFRSTDFGDDKDRVLVKQDGEYTYFTSDIAYHRKKIEKKFDELIDIWGADHHGYIPRVQAVIQALGYPKESLRVLLVQMVSLLRGGKPVQMSKRTGEFVSLREVIAEVGADTAKFIFLTRRSDSHLEFDLEVAKAQSAENPVFYVQYANARINSIFANAKTKGFDTGGLEDTDLGLLSAQEEVRIIKKLLSYPIIFEGAVIAHEPHRITFFLQEIAGMFHPYYHKYKVVTDDIRLTGARLSLCEAIRVVIKDGFEILGLSAPERM
ncbi:MAG: arginine--tRNA ligase [Nitrospirae bacterium]|nr:MAG: arginine--tRNA ligase [Nitrospirota bacterium]